MINAKYFLILACITASVACSSEGSTINMKEKKAPNIIQKTFDASIQPQINSLNKAKALEGKLKKIEEERLKTIGGFEE